MTNKPTEQQLKIHLYSIEEKTDSDNVNLRIEITPTLRDVLKSLTINEIEKLDLSTYDLFNDLNNNDKNVLRDFKIYIKSKSQKEIDNSFSKAKQKELNALLDKMTLERYKVKSVFYGSIFSNYKDFLFIKDLLDKCKIDLPIYQVGSLNTFTEHLKNSIRDIFNSLRNLNFNQEISLKPLDDKKLESVNKAIQERITIAQQERERQLQNRELPYTENSDGILECNHCGNEINLNNGDGLINDTDDNGSLHCVECGFWISN